MPSNIANEIQRYISDIFSKYYDLLFFNVKIRDSISRLYNNSREHSNKAFIVLIVGPVKSGKSTLVNLIANSYVSPTDFIECTVRTSIISKKNENETPAIEVFVSKHNNNEHSGEQVDQIIDNLRGLISKEDIDGVTQRSFDLTNDNISRYVSLKLLDAKQDNTLMTSIRTHGGNLLKDNVFVIDMPGFDGAYANLDDPSYKTIANRADLIIFVQSSNSAVSKISTEFLSMLKMHNADVPVCLIHNIFDAAYWRKKEIKTSIIADQKKFAIEEINRQGFILNQEYAFSINLGMVNDFRDKNYENESNILQIEADRFLDIENRLYELIISKRDHIRIKNCINRTRQQKHLCTSLLNEEIRQITDKENFINKINSTFDSLLRHDVSVPNIEPFSISALYSELKEQYARYNDKCGPLITDRGKEKPRKFNTDNARAIICEMISKYQEIIYKHINDYFKQFSNFVFYDSINEWRSEINQILDQYHLNASSANIKITPPTIDIDLSFDENIEHMIPRLFWKWSKHNSSDMLNWIHRVFIFYAGKQDGTNPYKGLIATNITDKVHDITIKYIGEIKKEILEQYNAYITRNKLLALKNLDIDINTIKHQKNILENVLQDMTSFNIPQL